MSGCEGVVSAVVSGCEGVVSGCEAAVSGCEAVVSGCEGVVSGCEAVVSGCEAATHLWMWVMVGLLAQGCGAAGSGSVRSATAGGCSPSTILW